MKLRISQGVFFGMLFISYAHAQSVDRRAATSQGPAEFSSTVIRDALNRPCLDVEAIARPHTINKAVMDHVVSVKNICNRTIKIKACYLNTDTCREFSVSAYTRVDAILGTMTGVNFFRYSLSQK